MDDATGQLGNNSTEISYLVSGKNGVRIAIIKMSQLLPVGAVIETLTQFVLHSLNVFRHCSFWIESKPMATPIRVRIQGVQALSTNPNWSDSHVLINYSSILDVLHKALVLF